MGRKKEDEIQKKVDALAEKIGKLIDELRLFVKHLAREVVRIVDWLVKPNKDMADILEKIAFLLLGASIIFRARGW